MVNFTNIQRSAAAAVGALLISTAFVAAAVGPATSVGQGTTSYAAAQVTSSVQANA